MSGLYQFILNKREAFLVTEALERTRDDYEQSPFAKKYVPEQREWAIKWCNEKI